MSFLVAFRSGVIVTVASYAFHPTTFLHRLRVLNRVSAEGAKRENLAICLVSSFNPMVKLIQLDNVFCVYSISCPADARFCRSFVICCEVNQGWHSLEMAAC
jgi:hypothetical protein